MSTNDICGSCGAVALPIVTEWHGRIGSPVIYTTVQMLCLGCAHYWCGEEFKIKEQHDPIGL